MDEVKPDLATWMERRRRFTSENHVIDITDQNRNQLDLLGQLERKRNDFQSDIAQTRSTVEMMRRMQDQPEVDLPNLTSPAASDALAETRRHVVEQEARVAHLRERYRAASPHATNALQTLNTT